MKIVRSAFALFALSKGASAWSSNAVTYRLRVGRSALYPSLAALHSFTVEQAGETATESFRLKFKGEVRT